MRRGVPTLHDSSSRCDKCQMYGWSSRCYPIYVHFLATLQMSRQAISTVSRSVLQNRNKKILQPFSKTSIPDIVTVSDLKVEMYYIILLRQQVCQFGQFCFNKAYPFHPYLTYLHNKSTIFFKLTINVNVTTLLGLNVFKQTMQPNISALGNRTASDYITL